MPDASEITRRAKSNLAFALQILPKHRRNDMVIFYAFCRTMDDLSDAPGIPPEQRQHHLESWKSGLHSGFQSPSILQQQVSELIDRQKIPNHLLTAIIDGCIMDLNPQNFGTWDDLSGYIWKVACAVGLVSIRIFGCHHPDSETYAIELGHALQLTNILRDIREDEENGRLYLPLDELARFDCNPLEIRDLAKNQPSPNFLSLMNFQADRAEAFFQNARKILPANDRKALMPAQIMAEIYQSLLKSMRRDNFRVFEKRYSISNARKFAILSKQLIAGWL